jgi:Fe-S oxidoreductase
MELKPEITIIHHSTMINNFLEQGELKLNEGNGKQAVYHDPCYLSRYDAPAGWQTPRSVLQQAGVTVLEPERTRDRSFCCGAGGAQLFNEETVGERVPHNRTKELVATGAKEIAAACPFCPIMLRDALAVSDVEDVAVKDIAQYVAERMS